jgi:hypothetical protein
MTAAARSSRLIAPLLAGWLATGVVWAAGPEPAAGFVC